MCCGFGCIVYNCCVMECVRQDVRTSTLSQEEHLHSAGLQIEPENAGVGQPANPTYLENSH